MHVGFNPWSILMGPLHQELGVLTTDHQGNPWSSFLR